MTTNRDYDAEHLAEKGGEILNQAMQAGYEACLKAHTEEWAKRWNMADIQIDGDDEAQQGIRFNLFQLFSTYYGEDARLNIGPRGSQARSMAVRLIGIPKPMPCPSIWQPQIPRWPAIY